MYRPAPVTLQGRKLGHIIRQSTIANETLMCLNALYFFILFLGLCSGLPFIEMVFAVFLLSAPDCGALKYNFNISFGRFGNYFPFKAYYFT